MSKIEKINLRYIHPPKFNIDTQKSCLLWNMYVLSTMASFWVSTFHFNPYTLKNKHSDGGWKMRGYVKFRSATPLKFNMEPENGGSEDVFPFQLGDSYVPC